MFSVGRLCDAKTSFMPAQQRLGSSEKLSPVRGEPPKEEREPGRIRGGSGKMRSTWRRDLPIMRMAGSESVALDKCARNVKGYG